MWWSPGISVIFFVATTNESLEQECEVPYGDRWSYLVVSYEKEVLTTANMAAARKFDIQSDKLNINEISAGEIMRALLATTMYIYILFYENS